MAPPPRTNLRGRFLRDRSKWVRQEPDTGKERPRRRDVPKSSMFRVGASLVVEYSSFENRSRGGVPSLPPPLTVGGGAIVSGTLPSF